MFQSLLAQTIKVANVKKFHQKYLFIIQSLDKRTRSFLLQVVLNHGKFLDSSYTFSLSFQNISPLNQKYNLQSICQDYTTRIYTNPVQNFVARLSGFTFPGVPVITSGIGSEWLDDVNTQMVMREEWKSDKWATLKSPQ